ncbi:MAG: hypothetical protein NT121_08470 [Chloroflexi bacterium]|nr:hypothetical protein [Chloroflexota bacterium]
MKPRERVLAALNHEEPDRCPMQVSFTPEFAARLQAEMKLGGDKLHNPHGGGNTYELERALGEDMLLSSVGWANSYYQDANEYVDEWGIGWHHALWQRALHGNLSSSPGGRQRDCILQSARPQPA